MSLPPIFTCLILAINLILILLSISEKQQHGKVLSESLVETAAHNWVDLGNAREMGEEIHATYRREMETTWGPDHITTIPEDYAQHVILGVSFVKSSTKFWPILCLPSNVSPLTYDDSLFQALRLL